MENRARGAVIALAGNPNTGKSTIFNHLTGLRQHTGNWSGKTVTNANGQFVWEGISFNIFDLPGIYSILSDSAEECCAKEFICFQKPDITVVVIDATCLERNLTLALQVMELTDNVVICLNLMDEAKKKGISIDVEALRRLIGVPVITACARDGKGMLALKELLLKIVLKQQDCLPIRTVFHDSFKNAVATISQTGSHLVPAFMNADYFFSQIIEEDACLYAALRDIEGYDDIQIAELLARGEQGRRLLLQDGMSLSKWKEEKSLAFLNRSNAIAGQVISELSQDAQNRERWLDKIILSKVWGIPFMLCLLGIVFWITIAGANIPSGLLMEFFYHCQERLGEFLTWCGVPLWLHGLLNDGVFLTVSWVVAVMLPPMAIFFPLFTLLEDFGLLPRIAFNLDGLFQKAHAHGKQALSMCMGFGCNAAGITSCRIIEAPRERMVAILTNNFVPCNGRFAPPSLRKHFYNQGGCCWFIFCSSF